MPFVTKWLLKNRITLTTATDVLTIDETIKMSHRIVELSEENTASTPVLLHSIVDTLRVSKQPGLQDLVKVRGEVKVPSHPGWTIFVNKPHSIIRFITGIVVQLFNLRFRYAESVPEALALLQQLDKTLPDLSGLIREQSDAQNAVK